MPLIMLYDTICLSPSPQGSSIFDSCNGVLNSDEVKLLLEDILPKNISVNDYEVEYLCSHLGKKNYLINAVQIVQGGEKQQKILIAVTDITLIAKEKSKLSEEKNDLNKVKNDLDTFVYSASHDLKGPINNIERLVSHLERSIDCGVDCQELTKKMEESVVQFKHTLEDLSSIGKAQEEGKKNIAIVDFKEVLEEVKFDLQDSIFINQAIIIDDFSKAPSIKISKNSVRTVFYNIVSNAIKYRSPDRNPKITISTESIDEKYTLLEISDNGIGIKKEDLGKVFSMYKRLHTDIEGTGVGMAIVSRIVDNNGGKIEVESEIDQGSTFKVYFRK